MTVSPAPKTCRSSRSCMSLYSILCRECWRQRHSVGIRLESGPESNDFVRPFLGFARVVRPPKVSKSCAPLHLFEIRAFLDAERTGLANNKQKVTAGHGSSRSAYLDSKKVDWHCPLSHLTPSITTSHNVPGVPDHKGGSGPAIHL